MRFWQYFTSIALIFGRFYYIFADNTKLNTFLSKKNHYLITMCNVLKKSDCVCFCSLLLKFTIVHVVVSNYLLWSDDAYLSHSTYWHSILVSATFFLSLFFVSTGKQFKNFFSSEFEVFSRMEKKTTTSESQPMNLIKRNECFLFQ